MFYEKMLVAMTAIAALLVVGTEAMRSGHVVFAYKGINVQTSTTQGCVSAGGTSGITILGYNVNHLELLPFKSSAIAFMMID